jgi:hypothetical protein
LAFSICSVTFIVSPLTPEGGIPDRGRQDLLLSNLLMKN